jgi:hypothetical protein
LVRNGILTDGKSKSPDKGRGLNVFARVRFSYPFGD